MEGKPRRSAAVKAVPARVRSRTERVAGVSGAKVREVQGTEAVDCWPYTSSVAH